MKRPPPVPGAVAVAPTAGHRGRPLGSARAERSESVSAWLPLTLHDKLIKLAQHQEQSVSATIRALLILRLR